ncbi:MAG: hypothetical protein WCI17_12570 [bacterium]
MADASQGEINKPSAFISERHRNPAETMAQGPKASYLWAGLCAIVATIVFGILLAVLYMDWTALNPA